MNWKQSVLERLEERFRFFTVNPDKINLGAISARVFYSAAWLPDLRFPGAPAVLRDLGEVFFFFAAGFFFSGLAGWHSGSLSASSRRWRMRFSFASCVILAPSAS